MKLPYIETHVRYENIHSDHCMVESTWIEVPSTQAVLYIALVNYGSTKAKGQISNPDFRFRIELHICNVVALVF